AVAAVAGIWVLASDDLLEATRQRVPLGVNEDIVALGRQADAAVSKLSGGNEWNRRVLSWEYDDDLLLVEFDEDGQAVRARTDHWHDLPPWERIVVWLQS